MVVPPPILPRAEGPPYPHGDADGAVHVAFVQPPVLGESSLLRAERGGILGEKGTTQSGSYGPVPHGARVPLFPPIFSSLLPKHAFLQPQEAPTILTISASSRESGGQFSNHTPFLLEDKKANAWKTSQRLSSRKGE